MPACLTACTTPHSVLGAPQAIQLLISVPRLPVALAEVTPDVVEDALRLAAQLRVTLDDAWVRAAVRVTLSPLWRRLPVVGAVQVRLWAGGGSCGWALYRRPSPACWLLRSIPFSLSPHPQVGLVRLPEFGYELDLTLASAGLVPLIKEWLDAAVRDMVLQVGHWRQGLGGGKDTFPPEHSRSPRSTAALGAAGAPFLSPGPGGR